MSVSVPEILWRLLAQNLAVMSTRLSGLFSHQMEFILVLTRDERHVK